MWLILMGGASAVSGDDTVPGRALAFDGDKGNCLACHAIGDATSFGDVGPALTDLRARYDRDALRAQIWDATASNPNSLMPPYGRHGILTEAEIDAITDFLWSL